MSGCVIGVDLGGTKLLAGAVDRELNVHHRAYRPVQARDQAQLLDWIVEAVEEARAAVTDEVRAVGFGIPCLMDQSRGMALLAVNIPLTGIPFRDVMAERLGLPVAVDNDANVAMLAEHRFGAAQGTDHALMLTVGTGVGSGVVVEGHVLRGAIGTGAELGHMVIDMDGPPCQGVCPNRGCLEVMASGTALLHEAAEAARRWPSSALGLAIASGQELTGPLVTESAQAGDAAARYVIALIGRRLGVGMASLVNIFNPEVVVLGGGVIAAGDLVLEPARAEMTERALPPSRDTVRMVAARFGTESGMLGAAVLALDELDETVVVP
jgi:glucokinase